MELFKKVDIKKLAVSLGISLGIGAVSGLIAMPGQMNFQETVAKPPLTPPSFLFPIVWTILYILMGISAYLVYMADGDSGDKNKALTVYAAQLVVNFFYSIIFFNMQAYLFASIWVILLWCLIIAMIYFFSKVNKTAAYLQIPYLLWVTFATYLTIGVCVLN